MPKTRNYIIDAGIEFDDMAAIWSASIFMLSASLIGARTTLVQAVSRA